MKLTKAELLEFADIVLADLNKNKKDNWLFIAKIKADKFMIANIPEPKLQLYWSKFFEFLDVVQGRNDRKGCSELNILNKIQENKMHERRKEPEIVSEYDFLRRFRHGGMRDD